MDNNKDTSQGNRKLTRGIAVVGTTASGKSALAVKIAQLVGGEIISADSMQIYRGMDIGTAKITAAEQCGIPHHLIDVCAPDECFSAADYARLALSAFDDISARGKVPVFCGGTGLYLESAMFDRHDESTPECRQYRAELEKFVSENSPSALHEMLEKIDPDAAAAIHENNVKRVIRALEIYHVSGKTKTSLDRGTKEIPPRLDLFTIGLAFHDRDLLLRRIDARVDKMIADGLCDEVKTLHEKKMLNPDFTSSQGIGYKEMSAYISGGITLDAAIEQIKIATHKYAKRQMTWFLAKPYVHWIFADKDGVMKDGDEIFGEAVAQLRENKFI